MKYHKISLYPPIIQIPVINETLNFSLCNFSPLPFKLKFEYNKYICMHYKHTSPPRGQNVIFRYFQQSPDDMAVGTGGGGGGRGSIAPPPIFFQPKK